MGGVSRLHDDKARLCPGILCRDNQVYVPEHPAPRLIEHHGTQCAVLLNELSLLPECFTWRRVNSAYNHIADLALGVAADDTDGPVQFHVGLFDDGYRDCLKGQRGRGI